MLALNANPKVVQFTGDGQITKQDAAQILTRCASQFTERGIGRIVVLDRATGEKLGWSGLIWIEDRQVIDLGYRFSQEHWGKGYATESSLECLRYGFEDLKFDEISARVDSRNIDSLKVLKKLGFSEGRPGKDDRGEFLDFIMSQSEYFQRK